MSEMQGEMVYKEKTAYQQRCDLCGRVRHEMYRYKIGQFNYRFCSLMHAQTAKKNFEYKIQNGISPVNLQPITANEGSLPSDEADNMGAYE